MGKTSIASVYARGVFPPEDEWIPSEVYEKDINISGMGAEGGGEDVKLWILDMAHDENRQEFAGIFDEYMAGAGSYFFFSLFHTSY